MAGTGSYYILCMCIVQCIEYTLHYNVTSLVEYHIAESIKILLPFSLLHGTTVFITFVCKKLKKVEQQG
jgi:hypothetical protein